MSATKQPVPARMPYLPLVSHRAINEHFKKEHTNNNPDYDFCLYFVKNGGSLEHVPSAHKSLELCLTALSSKQYFDGTGRGLQCNFMPDTILASEEMLDKAFARHPKRETYPLHIESYPIEMFKLKVPQDLVFAAAVLKRTQKRDMEDLFFLVEDLVDSVAWLLKKKPKLDAHQLEAIDTIDQELVRLKLSQPELRKSIKQIKRKAYECYASSLG